MGSLQKGNVVLEMKYDFTSIMNRKGMNVDAIVNAVNPSLLGGVAAWTTASIRPQSRDCWPSAGRQAGTRPAARKSPGPGSSYRYVIHAVVPRWRGGGYGERDMLISCYRTALLLAKEKAKSTPIPLIPLQCLIPL